MEFEWDAEAHERQAPESGGSMSPEIDPRRAEDMRPEYDFSQGVRGKHHEAYRAGTNVVFLEPDIAEVFRDSATVNKVLRLLLQLAKENVPSR